MTDTWMSFLPVALFIAWLFFSTNARAPHCPECGSPLPVFQSPFTKTRRQWTEGGYVCLRCGCETDRAGFKAVKGTSPQWLWVALAIGLPTLSLLTALFALATMFRR